ncbi:MAG TPA: NAD(P)H-binding protein [Gaiellaceae bacterium]|nr:NAD(P)H-binding protein [Gaiellaceae bacterium]
MADGTVLVTGATGHVGSNLIRELLREGRPVRALSRGPYDRTGVEPVQGDVLDRDSLTAALEDVSAAYYLVHALASGGGFGDEELAGARNFADAARDAGVERIVYLGGLAHGDDLSDHLRARHEVGEVLRASGVLTIELRASVVIGEGSASFELVRALVDYLPALVLPDWIETACQPIALADVVEYLVQALDVAVPGSAVFEIGGADRITYRRLLEEYARAVGVDRPTLALPAVPVPFGSWLTSGAPEQVRVWAKLADSLRFDSTVQDEAALHAFDVRPRGIREAIADVVPSAAV